MSVPKEERWNVLDAERVTHGGKYSLRVQAHYSLRYRKNVRVWRWYCYRVGYFIERIGAGDARDEKEAKLKAQRCADSDARKRKA